ncbi:hypothetical protein ZTR_04459 [Talaromyces verruculosus]|nr:hypothetical protein ZTR_04459 [Talaromyces verruculosus]
MPHPLHDGVPDGTTGAHVADGDLEKQESEDGLDGASRRVAGNQRTSDGGVILTESDVYDKLGFKFPFWKKWGILVCRALGGLSSAGGSVTLGMVADMWEPDDQQYAVAFIVLSSVAGSAFAPIAGGPVTEWLSWHWNFWIQLIIGGAVQAIHFWVPETRCSILVTREAQRRRKRGENVYSYSEVKNTKFEWRPIITVWLRPFLMFAREPIVLWLSLLSGFSDSLIFTFLQAYTPVYQQWGFGDVRIGLCFVTIIVGYVIAYLSFLPWIYKHTKIRKRDPDALQPESRLYWLLWTAPLETIGLFGFAWTSIGPPHSHWIAPMIFSACIAIANYAIYMATIDYMVAAYGPYSASATGGNALARDFLAGIAAMYSTPMYENMGTTHHLQWPTTLLGILCIFITGPIYIFYWFGPRIREKSKFAQVLASDRKAKGERAVRCGSETQGAEATYLGSQNAHTGSLRGTRASASAYLRGLEGLPSMTMKRMFISEGALILA